LIAKNKQGQTEEKRITVKVTSPLPEIGLFRADRESIREGEAVKLQWKTVNADKVELFPIGKQVGASGSVSLKPGITTTYILAASSREGQIEKKRLNVKVTQIFKPLGISCPDAVQGKIAWDYKDSKNWAKANIDRLCKGATNTSQPAVCFNKVMHGGINYGGGTKWQWQNAIDLCEGTQHADRTIQCFNISIGQGKNWKTAIASCGK
jgi:hypothetical protein